MTSKFVNFMHVQRRLMIQTQIFWHMCEDREAGRPWSSCLQKSHRVWNRLTTITHVLNVAFLIVAGSAKVQTRTAGERSNMSKFAWPKLYEKWSQTIYNQIIMRESRDLMRRVSTRILWRAEDKPHRNYCNYKKGEISRRKGPEVDCHRSSQLVRTEPCLQSCVTTTTVLKWIKIN